MYGKYNMESVKIYHIVNAGDGSEICYRGQNGEIASH